MVRNKSVILLGFIGLFLISYSITHLIYGIFANNGDNLPAKTSMLKAVNLSTASDLTLVNPNTKITKIEYFKCGEILSKEISNKEWQGRSYIALKNQYKVEDGWLIGRSKNDIYLSRHVNELCPKHNKRHLGIYKGQLAIYQGPLGLNEKVLAIDKYIKIADLPMDFQTKLKEAMTLTNSKISIRKDLIQELEFANDAEVEDAMQNLDEYAE
jgi:hypothetical protein